MDEKRIFGLETEYSVSLRRSDGSFHHAPDTRRFFFLPVQRALFSDENRDVLLRRIALMRDHEIDEYWVGASAGKLYHDRDSIEYATPECGTLAGIERAAQCGDRIVRELSCLAYDRYDTDKYAGIHIVKNNSDAIGGMRIQEAHFSGSHESYQINGRLIQNTLFLPALASCLAMRMLFTGGGGMVREKNTGWQYVISPRGLATNTIYHPSCSIAEFRPMISYRGDVHFSLDWLDTLPRHCRLHIAVNDSTMRPDTIRFRFGFISMLLRIFENRRKTKMPPFLQDPIRALHDFSRDATLTAFARLENGSTRTLPELCRDWLDFFSEFNAGNPSVFSSEEQQLLQDAESLFRIRESDPGKFLQNTEWGLKLFLLSAYCRKKGIDFAHPYVRGFDGYYSDIGPYGFYHRWERSRAGRTSGTAQPFSREEMEILLSDTGIAPRALLRKRYLEVLAATHRRTVNLNWGSFELSNGDLVEIPDPLRGKHSRIEADIARLKRTSAL